MTKFLTLLLPLLSILLDASLQAQHPTAFLTEGAVYDIHLVDRGRLSKAAVKETFGVNWIRVWCEKVTYPEFSIGTRPGNAHELWINVEQIVSFWKVKTTKPADDETGEELEDTATFPDVKIPEVDVEIEEASEEVLDHAEEVEDSVKDVEVEEEAGEAVEPDVDVEASDRSEELEGVADAGDICPQ